MKLATATEAEEAVVGSMLYNERGLTHAIDTLVASDFAAPSLGDIFDAAKALWLRGDKVDVVAVAEFLGPKLEQAGGIKRLNELFERSPAFSPRHAMIVVEHAARRNVALLCARAIDDAPTSDPLDLVDALIADLRGVDMPVARVPDDLWRLDDFRAQPHTSADWVLEGLLRQGQRCVLVAGEGVGKSLVLQQLAMCAAGGIHPFRFNAVPAVPSLLVDLENDAERITHGTARVDNALLPAGDVWLWSKPGGIDLRTRRDRSMFEAVVRHCRPKLVCMGPIYKAYNAKASESHELVAKELQQVFDDLRTRYGFALVLEHHAPQGVGSERDMRPYGSSYWLRWPEFGFGLKKLPRTDDRPGNDLEIKRWRGDRVASDWPVRLDVGQTHEYPWVGYWGKAK